MNYTIRYIHKTHWMWCTSAISYSQYSLYRASQGKPKLHGIENITCCCSAVHVLPVMLHDAASRKTCRASHIPIGRPYHVELL